MKKPKIKLYEWGWGGIFQNSINFSDYAYFDRFVNEVKYESEANGFLAKDLSNPAGEVLVLSSATLDRHGRFFLYFSA